MGTKIKKAKRRTGKLIWVLQLVVINIIVLTSLVLFLNLAAITVYQLFPGWVSNQGTEDQRYKLPNYDSIDWALQHFTEFNNLPTEYRSYVGWRRLAFEGQTINIDEAGIRTTPQNHQISDSALLVVFLGGSAMWGTGVNDTNTIPAHFSGMSGGDFLCVNLAESNFNAYQSYLFLRHQIMTGMRPDIVISYDGFNDRCNPSGRPFSHARDAQIRKIMKGKDRQDRFEVLSFKTVFYRPISTFVTMLKTKYMDHEKAELPVVKVDQLKENAKILLESWLAIKHLAEKNNAKFVAVLQPYASCGNPTLEHLESGDEWSADPFYYYPYIFDLLEERRYTELSSCILNFSHVFDGDEIYYIDFCHVSPNGNQIVAKEMHNYIAKHYVGK